MKRFQMMAVLAGVMLLASGCGADGETTEPVVSESLVQNTVVAETQSETEPETKVQSEEQTTEEVETQVQTQTVVETETQSQSETETAAQTETEKETQTESKAEQTQPAQEAAAGGAVSAGDYAVSIGGLTLPLGGDMRDYAGMLGEPDAYGSARSCTEAGEDKVYTYGGTVIYTYVTNGADIISLIEVTGGDYLPAGIHIGSTKEDVIAAYGSNYVEDGSELLYEVGGKTIGLQITNDKVSFIELFGQ